MTDEAATSHGVIFQIISIEWLFDAKLPKLISAPKNGKNESGKPHMCLLKRAGQSPINLNPRAISGVKNSSSRIPHLETNSISSVIRIIEESNLFKHVIPLHFSRLHNDAL